VEVGFGGCGSHSRDNSELVGSSLVAWRGKDAAWGRLRRVWGCSPREESDRDGPVEEIDEEVCSLAKNRGRRNWSEEEDERRD